MATLSDSELHEQPPVVKSLPQARSKRWRRGLYQTMNDLIELTDDEDELLELLSHSSSLMAIAENVIKLRRAEQDLVRKKLKRVRGERKSLKVSDHAIVRYLERVTGIDIDALRKELIERVPEDYQYRDIVEYIPVPDKDLQFIIRDGMVITICPLGKYKPHHRVIDLVATDKEPK